MGTSTDRINYLNVALMVAAAGAAFAQPLEVFLFAYAVLGPLHYLTEISWLHDRNYFLRGKRDGYPLLVLCVLICLISATDWPAGRKNEVITLLNYTAFAGAVVLLLASTATAKVIAFALIALSFGITRHSESCLIFFGVLLPTIVHVFIFTAAFVTLGALRAPSRSAFASLAVFGLCSISFFIYTPMWTGHLFPASLQGAYARLEHLNLPIFRVFHVETSGSPDLRFRSTQWLALVRFIAFAYLYHYLNWFSKTSVIGWNRISPPRAFAIVSLWLGSMWTYTHDSRTGLTILVTLSFAHGLLELPLDHRTCFNVGRELVSLLRRRFERKESPSGTDSTGTHRSGRIRRGLSSGIRNWIEA